MRQQWAPAKPFGLPKTPFDPVTGRYLALGAKSVEVRLFTILYLGDRYLTTTDGTNLAVLECVNGDDIGTYVVGDKVAAIRLDQMFAISGMVFEWLVLGSGAAETAYLALFDLVDVETDSFAILGTGQSGSAAWIAGVKKTLAVAGCTWDGTDRWDVSSIVESKCVYILADRSAATMTLTVGATFPAGSDTERVFPLWYVPWIPPTVDEDGYIDAANIIDMRNAKQIEAMA